MKNQVFKEAREKYENIVAPNNLKKEVNNIFKAKNNKLLKITLSSIASIAICFVIAININPVLASNLSTNQFMKKIVSVLTINKYELSENNFYASVITPKITGLTDPIVEKRINDEINLMSSEIIANFSNDVSEIKEKYPDAHIGVDSGYIVKTDNEKYLSIDIYVVNMAGSSSTRHKFYNVDKITGDEISLKDIFNFSNYVEYIANIIYNDTVEQNKLNGHDIFYATYDEILNLLLNKEEFYINSNGNPVIVFDKYEIGIGAIGCPEFEIMLEK